MATGKCRALRFPDFPGIVAPEPGEVFRAEVGPGENVADACVVGDAGRFRNVIFLLADDMIIFDPYLRFLAVFLAERCEACGNISVVPDDINGRRVLFPVRLGTDFID